MRFAFPLVAILFVSTGCPNYVPYLPDGGRARVNCNATPLKAPITVLNEMGEPVPEAVVAIEYTSYGESANLITDARGLVLVEDLHGPGTVKVSATSGSLRSGVSELNFVGTECSEAVTPRSLTITVKLP
jgi:hypothetical protein